MRYRWHLLIFCILVTAGLRGGGQTTQPPKDKNKPPQGSQGPGFVAPGLGGVVPKKKKNTPPPSSTQAPPKGTQEAPRFVAPGIGGLLPPRKAPPTVPPPGGNTRPLLGPFLPGQGPAPVLVPGQDPTLPGLPGLQARSVSPLLYGINMVWPPTGKTEGDRQAGARRMGQFLKGAGITNVRVPLAWAEIERVRGKYDWREPDHLVKFLTDLGVTPLFVVTTTPEWAFDASPAAFRLFRPGDRSVYMRAPEPAFYADLGRFAHACALRYKAKVKHWEFWDAPDGRGMPVVVKDATGRPTGLRPGTDPKTYAQLLKVFSTNVKRADPTARVAVGGLEVLKTDFLAALYANGAKPHFDAVAFHPPADPNGLPFDWIDRCRDLVLRQGDAAKTFWITAWGWEAGSIGKLTELHQARLIRETLNAMRDRPFITQASYAALSDARADADDPNSLLTYGLLTKDLQPRPAYTAFREMVTGPSALPARRYARVPLTGGLPMVAEGGVRGGTVNVVVDADRPGAPLPPLWEGFAQGNEALNAEAVEKMIVGLRALGARLVRFDPFPDPSAVRRERILIEGGDADSAGAAKKREFQIDWRFTDERIDAISRAGAKPMLNFATMPSSLSAPSGNTRLPRENAEWADFIETVVRRYNGEQKRGIVYWELSNAPNRGDYTLQEWLRLYETFARAVTKADPNAKVGGPSTADFDEAWLKGLIEYCGRNSVPLHFVSRHAYGQAPEEYARQAVALRDDLKRYPALKNVELFVSEWNVSARLTPQNDGLAGAAYALSVVESLLNTTEAGPLRSLFYQVAEGPDFRTPNALFNGRWGMLTHYGQPKAVYNAFHLLSRMDGARLPAASEETNVRVLASRDKDRVRVLVWRAPTTDDRRLTTDQRATTRVAPTLDSRLSTLDSPVLVQVRGLGWNGGTQGAQWTLDARHGNAHGVPTRTEPAQMLFQTTGGDVEIPVVVAPNAAALIELTPAPASRLELSLQSPRYVIYGGSAYNLVATVRNTDTKPQTVTLVLSSPDAALIPSTRTRSKPISLAPGETKSFAYTLTAPLQQPEGQEFFTLTAEGVGAIPRSGETVRGSGVGGRKEETGRPVRQVVVRSTPDTRPPTPVSASVAVKFASPLQAQLAAERADVLRPGALPDSQASVTRLKVVLENRADTMLKVGIVSPGSSLALNVPARQTATVPINVAATASTPGRYPVPVKILLGQDVVATLNGSVGVPALCRYATRTPRINGDLSEWTEAFALPLAPGGGVGESGAAPTAQAFTLWDEKFFYLAVTVPEETLFSPFAPQEMGRGDSVLFALDTLRNARPDQEGYDADDYEFGLAKATLGAHLYRFFSANGANPGLIDTREGTAKAAIARVGNRTIYEAAIPWAELAPLRPRDNALVGFSLLVNDSDGQARSTLEWAGGIAGEKRPGKFIGLRLVKE